METNSLEGSICLQSLDPERGCSLKPRTRAVVSSLCFGPGATLQKSPWPGAPAMLGVNPKNWPPVTFLTVVRGCWGLWTLAPPSLTCPAGMRSLSNTGRSSCLLLRPRGQVVDPASWFSREALQRQNVVGCSPKAVHSLLPVLPLLSLPGGSHHVWLLRCPQVLLPLTSFPQPAASPLMSRGPSPLRIPGPGVTQRLPQHWLCILLLVSYMNMPYWGMDF